MPDILFFFTNRENFQAAAETIPKNRPDMQGADHARKRLLSLLELREFNFYRKKKRGEPGSDR
ncbi:hypothetical protein B6187_22480 [Salmonella enterica]|nr:hypothetical protein [Salmonella enterica]